MFEDTQFDLKEKIEAASSDRNLDQIHGLVDEIKVTESKISHLQKEIA